MNKNRKEICVCGHFRHQHMYYGDGACGFNKSSCICNHFITPVPFMKPQIDKMKIFFEYWYIETKYAIKNHCNLIFAFISGLLVGALIF